MKTTKRDSGRNGHSDIVDVTNRIADVVDPSLRSAFTAWTESVSSVLNKQTTLSPVNIEKANTGKLSQQLGTSGQHRNTGFSLSDEFIPALQGDRAMQIYKEMSDNDATISAIIFALKMLVRAIEWRIVADVTTGKESQDSAEISPEQQDKIDWVKTVLFEDMETSWDDFMSEVLSFFVYGWSYFEVIYKQRRGLRPSKRYERSKYDDGALGVRKISIRPQETKSRWEIDSDGNVLGMWQLTGRLDEGIVFIPMWKSLLFRTETNKENPEGKSPLRNAYRPWYFLKNIQEYESIAIERELNGLPVVKIPTELLESTDTADQATVTKYVQLVRDVKFNETGGVVLPSDPYISLNGNYTNIPKVSFELIASKGTRAIDTNATIKRYQFDITRTVFADFLMLGVGDRGSFALSKSKIDLFLQSLTGWLEAIASVINKQLIPSLWELNGFDFGLMPKLEPGDIAPQNITELSEYIRNLSQAGMPLFPDPELENMLRHTAGLSERPSDDELPFPDSPDEEENADADSPGTSEPISSQV